MTQLTDDIYWESQPPQMQPLRTSPGLVLALSLATQGFKVVRAIGVNGDSPSWTMKISAGLGYTWLPTLLNNPTVQVAPGDVEPGMVSYDPNNPPPGSVKVSSDATDYPPFLTPPVPVPPPAVVSLVGFSEGMGGDGVEYWSALPAAASHLVNTQPYLDPLGRGSFTFHRIANMFGFSVWFTKP
jgi:hypothetical protein